MNFFFLNYRLTKRMILILFLIMMACQLTIQQISNGQYIIQTTYPYNKCSTPNSVNCEVDDFKQFQCEYGYFVFNPSYSISGQYCIQCPEYSPNQIQVMCGDCIENPFTWQELKRCTYDYKFLNYSLNTFQYTLTRQDKSQPTFYNIISRDDLYFCTEITDFKNILRFCSNSIDVYDGYQCQFDGILGIIYLPFVCLDGYYLTNSKTELQYSCQACPINCSICECYNCIYDINDDLSSKNGVGDQFLECYECKQGSLSNYSMEDHKWICVPCMQGCDECYYTNEDVFLTKSEGTQLRCQKFSQGYIRSLNQKDCDSCPTDCKRCEYTHYESPSDGSQDNDLEMRQRYPTIFNHTLPNLEFIQTNKYILRCRQCYQENYHLNYDGLTCVRCDITNCDRCYFQWNTNGSINTTLNIDFKPVNSNYSLKCKVCQTQYFLSLDGTLCTKLNRSMAINNCQSQQQFGPSLSDQKCIICQDKYFEYQNRCTPMGGNISFQLNCSIGSAENEVNGTIPNTICRSCGQFKYQGFYTDQQQITLQCQNCGQNCKECQQYSHIFNVTDQFHYNDFYHVNQFSEGICTHYDPQTQFWQAYQQFETQCLQCSNNYQLVNGSCYKIVIPINQDNGYTSVQTFFSPCSLNQYSLDQGRQKDFKCQVCVEGCQACRNRTQVEISKVNPYFSNEDEQQFSLFSQLCYSYDQQNYFYDQILGVPLNCLNTSKQPCFKSVDLNIILYCQIPVQKIEGVLSYNLTGFSSAQIYYFQIYSEQDQILKWNQQAIQQMNINYRLISNLQHTCDLNRGILFESMWKDQIFSLRFTQATFYSEDAPVQVYTHNLYFYYFNKVIIKNLVITSNGLSLYTFCSQITNFKMEKVIFQMSGGIIQLILQNTQDIQINDVKFQNINLLKKNIFQLDLGTQKIISFFYLNINNLKIEGSNFDYCNIFPFINIVSNNIEVVLDSITFNNCTFKNSLLFSDYGYITKNDSFSWIINNVNLYNSSLQNSSLVQINSGRNISISNWNMTSILAYNSTLFQMNTVNIMGLNFTDSFLDQSNYIVIQSTTKIIQIGNMIFSDSICNQKNCLIKTTVSSSLSKQGKIYIFNVIVRNMSYTANDSLLVSSAMLQISNFQTVNFQGLYSLGNQQLTLVYVNAIHQANFTDINCTGSQQGQNQPFLLNQDDVQNKSKNYAHNLYCIVVTEFTNLVKFQNLYINHNQALNQPIILIEGYINTKLLTNNTIILQNINVFQNNLEVSLAFQLSSLIRIQSQQVTEIVVQDSQFINNHMHHLFQASGICATNFLIYSELAIVKLNNITFYDNRATASPFGSIYILSKTIQVQNSQFSQFNLLNKEWDRDQTTFTIQCQGGHAFLSCQSLIINQSIFNTSYTMAGGLLIQSLDPAEITIVNCQFLNGWSDMIPTFDSRGGCLYVDALKSTTQLILRNISMINCISLTTGGGIYMIASDQQVQNVTLSDSTFIDCLSVSGSVMYGDFQTSVNLINIQNIDVSTQNHSQSGFLRDIAGFGYEWEKFMNQSYLFYLPHVVNLTVNNSQFHDLSSQGVFLLPQIHQLTFNQLNFSKILMVLNPIVNIIQIAQTTLIINNVFFSEINSRELLYSIDNCQQNNKSINDYGSYITKNMTTSERYPFQYLEVSESEQEIGLIKMVLQKKLEQFEMKNIKVSHHNYNKIANVYCENCTNGLISIFMFSSFKSIISNMECYNSKTGQYGCLAVTSLNQFDTIDISEVRMLQQNNASNSFGSKLMIYNSKFQSIIANYGAGVTIIKVDSVLIGCLFGNNQALWGGGLYFSSHQNAILAIFNSTFRQNSAIFGGAIYLKDSRIGQVEKCNITFKDNKAQEGESIKEIPSKIAIYLGVNGNFTLLNTQRIIDNHEQVVDQVQSDQIIYLPSGQQIGQYARYNESNDEIPLNLILRVINLNSFGQPQLSEVNSTCSIKLKESLQQHQNGTLKNNIQNWNETTQSFNFETLVINFDPNFPQDQFLELQITCNNIEIYNFKDQYPFSVVSTHQNYQLLMRVRTFACQQGEFINKFSCLPCQADLNEYQVEVQSTSCTIYDPVQISDATKTQLNLQNDYWRPYFQNDQIELCYNYKYNCLGGLVPGDSSCYPGNIGALCESCDIYGTIHGEKYSNQAQYICGPCPSDASSHSLIILGITVWIFFLTILTVYGTYQTYKMKILKSLPFIRSSPSIKSNDARDQAVLLKIFTNYTQIVSTVTTFRLAIPYGVQQTEKTTGNPIEIALYSLDCVLVDLTQISILYFRVIWAMLLPIFYLVVILIFYSFGVLINKLPKQNTVVYTTFIYMFIYLQPSQILALINLASSREISGIAWVQADISFQYGQEHQTWLNGFVIPLLLLWCVVFPLGLFYGVWSCRNELDKPINISRWGYILNEYNKDSYFWEFVKILQKELIIVFLAFYQDLIIVKAILVFLVVLLYQQIAKIAKPYHSNVMNSLDQYSASVCQLTVLVSALIYQCQQTKHLDEIILPGLLLIIFSNLLFFLYIIYVGSKTFSDLIDKFRDYLDRFKEFIKAKFPNIQNRCPSLGILLGLSKLSRIQTKARSLQLWMILRVHVRNTYKKNVKIHQMVEICNDQFDQPVSSPVIRRTSQRQEESQSLKQQLDQPLQSE